MRRSLYLLLCLVIATTMQAQKYSYRYWFDNNQKEAATGTVTGSSLDIDIDVSSLSESLHTLHFQVEENDTIPSTILTQHFIKPITLPEFPEYENTKLRILIDQQLASEEDAVVNGGIINLNFDVKDLAAGIHHLCCQLAAENEGVASIATAYFLKMFETPTFSNTKCFYYIDNNEAVQLADDIADGAFKVDIDVSSLPVGIHYIHAYLADDVGTVSATQTAYFLKAPLLPTSQKLKCFYSIDNNNVYYEAGEFAEGAYSLEFDATDLNIGLHSLHYYFQTEEGIVTDIKTAFFVRDLAMGQGIVRYEFNVNEGEYKTSIELDAPAETLQLTELQLPKEMVNKDISSFSFVAYDGNGGFVSSQVGFTKMPEPTFSYDGKKLLTIKTEVNGAKVYYRLEGQEDWIEYSSQITLTNNRPVQAFAQAEGYNDSEIAVFTPDNFKVSALKLSFKEPKLTISCPTEGAKILYSIDSELTDESEVYKEEIEITEPCKVLAIGKLDYFNSSDTARYEIKRVPTPVIVFKESTFAITCSLDGAAIRYTTDGSEPTLSSAEYQGEVPYSGNLTVKAIAYFDGMLHSATATQVQDGITVQTPTFDYDGKNQLTINCATSGAQIHYQIEGLGEAEEWLDYSEPLTLESNRTVYAYATAENWNDSEVTEFTPQNFKVGMVEISFNEPMLTIVCPTEGADIRFSLDGSEPTDESAVYSEPIEITEPCLVQAIGKLDYFNDSDVASYEVKRVPTPVIVFKESTFAITCSLDGSTIRYTTDGSEPTLSSAEYKAEVSYSGNLTVKAIAYFDGMLHSDMATQVQDGITVQTPTFDYDGKGLLTINCGTPGAQIHYKIQGLNKELDWLDYNGSLTLESNRTVYAYATAENWNDSEEAEFTPNNFKVETPKIELDGKTVTITCNTVGAEIFFTLNGDTPTKESEKFDDSFDVTQNCTVRAIAVKDYWNDSDVAELQVTVETVSDVKFSYDGRYLTMTTATEGATIRYTMDGSEPTEDSEVYIEPIDVGGLTTVKAFGAKDGMNPSGTGTFTVECYFDGEIAQVGTPGTLRDAFGWYGGYNGCQKLTVKGSLNGDDLKVISSMESLQFLNLEEADVERNVLDDGAFANSHFWIIRLPKSVKEFGSALFSGNRSIASLFWEGSGQLPEKALEGIDNPNLLLYVSNASIAPANVQNVVVNGEAERISLCMEFDNEKAQNFYCPKEFTAKEISYTHNFELETGRGECAGWETIVLPFDVKTIIHAKNGLCKPFPIKGEASEDDGNARNFWLYEWSENGFKQAKEIAANTPYIISMPNNSAYGDEYKLNGLVTFSAENCLIKETECSAVESGGVSFVPTMQAIINRSDGMKTLNRKAIGNYNPGSVFVGEERNVMPFEAYLIAKNGARMIRLDELAGWLDTAIDDISLTKKDMRVYDLSGRLIKILQSEDEIRKLPKGLYIINNKKIKR